jgi:hypothetical protein
MLSVDVEEMLDAADLGDRGDRLILADFMEELGRLREARLLRSRQKLELIRARGLRLTSASDRKACSKAVREASEVDGVPYSLAGTPYSIEVVEGDGAPKLVGRSYHWTTPGGLPIRYPGAYRWPKVYNSSNRRIQVGEGWLRARDIDAFD